MTYDSRQELLAQVAFMYYDREMTQSAIGRELGLSRVKVYRLLKQAREQQIVRITIQWPMKRHATLEKALVGEFGLQEALVLASSPESRSPELRRLGQLGASYLEQALKEGMTLAVCFGRSTYEVIHAIRPGFKAGINVAQAMGSASFAGEEFDSSALARELAQRLGGQVRYLSSPLMADSAEAAEVLRRQRDIEATLAEARRANVALLGIGNLDPSNSSFVRSGALSLEALAQLKVEGAVGDIGGQIFDVNGNLHLCDYNRRLIGLTLAEMKRMPLTIAVASGSDKAQAILGALRTGIIKVLCTDDRAASKLLRMTH